MKSLVCVLIACFVVFPAVAQVSAAPERCIPVYPDAVACFIDAWVADAYGDVERAKAGFDALAAWQRAEGSLLTTNDPTRRALVVYPWDFTRGPKPVSAGDGYVVEMYRSADEAAARIDALSWEERAQSYLLPASEPPASALVIYRQFAARCRGAR